MKKCPKCHGRKIIQNYIMIDGGKCYACNAKGLVDDNYTLPKSRIEYEPPKWVLEKEKRAMDKAHENERNVRQRAKIVLNDLYNVTQWEVRDDVLSCIDSWIYSYETLIKLSDEDFQNVLVAAYDEYLQYA